MKVSKDVCNHCCAQNEECVELKGFLWFSYRLCQSCVSKSFRSFSKDK